MLLMSRTKGKGIYERGETCGAVVALAGLSVNETFKHLWDTLEEPKHKHKDRPSPRLLYKLACSRQQRHGKLCEFKGGRVCEANHSKISYIGYVEGLAWEPTVGLVTARFLKTTSQHVIVLNSMIRFLNDSLSTTKQGYAQEECYVSPTFTSGLLPSSKGHCTLPMTPLVLSVRPLPPA